MAKKRKYVPTEYDLAVDYILGLSRFGSKLSLDRAQALNKALGNPQEKLTFIHVAGTNGKGSTSTMIAAALTAAGYKTGLYTSPSVERFEERMQIDNQMMSEEDLVAAVAEMKNVVKSVLAQGLEHPTEFEVATSMAFAFFARQNCDVVVLETGLGGRFDATNTIGTPILSVITSISMDHTAYLGDTLAKIAYEKCGIIKSGAPVVCAYGQPAEAFDVIQKDCTEKGVQLIVPDAEIFTLTKEAPGELEFTYQNTPYRMNQTGRHFAENALTAIEALKALQGAGFRLTDEHIQAGVATTLPAGRMELLLKEPYIILDGAHNIDGIRRLTETLDTVFAGRRLITVMGMYRDKDYAACIPELAKRSHVFLASSPGGSRALKPLEVMDIAIAAGIGSMRGLEKGEGIVGLQENAYKGALTGARFIQNNSDVLLFCGSFGMLKDAKAQLTFVVNNRAKYNIF